MKTVRELIGLSADYLQEKGIESPRLNAERLLGDVLGLARIELYLKADLPVAGAQLESYRDLIRRRATGEPLQTLIGTTGFYSREFKVEPGVFIPRPETERLVERAAELLTPGDRSLVSPRIVDCCCGSGVIAVSLAAELPVAEVWALDTNPQALELTRRNAHRHGVDARVHPLESDLLYGLPGHLKGAVDLVVSNPPYIRSDELAGLEAEVQHDPAAALDGGQDGLDVHRALASQARRWLVGGGWLALEIGADQGETVPEILRVSGYLDVAMTLDWNDLPRVVVGQYPRSEV